MMIDIDESQLDGIVIACLKEALESAQWALDKEIISSDDVEHKELVKSLVRVLEYFDYP
jgi:hypothetical protein